MSHYSSSKPQQRTNFRHDVIKRHLPTHLLKAAHLIAADLVSFGRFVAVVVDWRTESRFGSRA